LKRYKCKGDRTRLELEKVADISQRCCPMLSGVRQEGRELVQGRKPIYDERFGGSLRTESPALTIKKGDKVVLKASHGIGHLINSILEVRTPPAKAKAE
jgi:hypothetical protein